MIQPSFSPIPYGDKLILNQEFKYSPMSGPYKELTVPDGFVFEPPFRSRVLTAFLIRDYMKTKGQFSPRFIDHIFMEALALNDVGPLERSSIYLFEILPGKIWDYLRGLKERVFS